MFVFVNIIESGFVSVLEQGGL